MNYMPRRRKYKKHKKSRLNKDQLDKLADIFVGMGHIFFASMVIPAFTGIDKPNPLVVLSGLVLSLASWTMSLLVLKRKKP